MMYETMTVQKSAMACVHTIPIIPYSRFRRNSIGMLNTSCRITASQKDSFPRPIACVKCTMEKHPNISGVAKHLARRNCVPNRTVCVEHIDPALVMSVVRKLGVEGLPNINYINAMKQAVGL